MGLCGYLAFAETRDESLLIVLDGLVLDTDSVFLDVQDDVLGVGPLRARHPAASGRTKSVSLTCSDHGWWSCPAAIAWAVKRANCVDTGGD